MRFRTAGALAALSCSLVCCSVVCATFILLHLPDISPPPTPGVVHDAGRIVSARVPTIVVPSDDDAVVRAVREAASAGRKVSVAGKRHTMGGHTFADDAIMIDMTGMNRIVSFDPARRRLVVQAGATWADIQRYLNPRGYAVIAMQGPNIFTVGGSLSVNAHGWDLTTPTVADTVMGFRLVRSDGTITRCSRAENSELFHLVLGGFGLFGIVLDAELEVTENTTLTPHYQVMPAGDVSQFISVLAEAGRGELGYVDLSISGTDPFREALGARFAVSRGRAADDLAEETDVVRDRFILALSRRYAWGKELRWALYKQWQLPTAAVSRNNLMRAPFERLRYHSPRDTDILQEVFVPIPELDGFVTTLRALVLEHRTNVLNCTLRLVRRSDAAFLNYAKRDSIAFVLYTNVGTDEESIVRDGAFLRALIGAATRAGGTFYLPYLPHYSLEEIREAYPEIDRFFELKRRYDPEERFTSSFYERYGRRKDQRAATAAGPSSAMR